MPLVLAFLSLCPTSILPEVDRKYVEALVLCTTSRLTSPKDTTVLVLVVVPSDFGVLIDA